MTTKSLGTLYIRNVPAPIKNLFRCYCYRHNITMTEQIIKMIEEVAVLELKTAPPPDFAQNILSHYKQK
mgnify:CR=1 FL=1